MKTTQSIYLITLSLANAAFLAFTPTMSATSVAVTNPGFETDVISTDGGATPNATGWTTVTGNTTVPVIGTALTDTVSTSNPTQAQFAGAAGLTGVAPGMSGPQCLLMQTALVGLSGSVAQTTGALLTLGQVYTLTVAVGNPGNGAFQGYSLSLLSGTNTLATTAVGDEYNVASGTFTDKTLTFVAGASVAGLVNTPVTIVLTTLPSVVTGSAVAFDNVRLDVAPVPEPTPLAAVALGFGLLLLVSLVKSQRRTMGVRESRSILELRS